MADAKKEAEKARLRAEERRRYFAFLDSRIPELHEQGKPPPVYDERGRAQPRFGDFPGILARRQADWEWAHRGEGI